MSGESSTMKFDIHCGRCKAVLPFTGEHEAHERIRELEADLLTQIAHVKAATTGELQFKARAEKAEARVVELETVLLPAAKYHKEERAKLRADVARLKQTVEDSEKEERKANEYAEKAEAEVERLKAREREATVLIARAMDLLGHDGSAWSADASRFMKGGGRESGRIAENGANSDSQTTRVTSAASAERHSAAANRSEAIPPATFTEEQAVRGETPFPAKPAAAALGSECECGDELDFKSFAEVLDFYGDETNKGCCRSTTRGIIEIFLPALAKDVHSLVETVIGPGTGPEIPLKSKTASAKALDGPCCERAEYDGRVGVWRCVSHAPAKARKEE